jgi:hypothetical protein
MRSLQSLRALRVQRPAAARLPLSALGPRSSIHTTGAVRAYKDDQDRESLNPKAPYGSQSKGDEAVSHNPDSYSRTKTDPASAKGSNPEELEVSGANVDLSKPQGDNAAKESRPTGPDRKERSGGNTTAGKGGKPNV